MVLNLPLRPPQSTLAVGQVLSVVQNEPPLNFYFNASAATESFEGTPAYRLSFGDEVVLEGSETDLNGYRDLSGSTCSCTATGYSTATPVSFNACNATYCNYTCSLTLSSTTPSGFYNVTSTILDDAGESSNLNETIYVFEFAIPSPSPTPALRALGGGGVDVLILRPAPSPRPTLAPSPAPSPAAPTPIVEVIEFKDFCFKIEAPEFIDKCSVKGVSAIVENKNPEPKNVVLQFEERKVELRLQAFENKSVSFKVEAPASDGDQTFLLQGEVYYNGEKVATAEKTVKLLWRGLDVCLAVLPTREFVFIAGRQSIAVVDLEAASDVRGASGEVEVFRNGKSVFLDIVDLKDYYYKTSFPVFEKGGYEAKVRVRKGFETLYEKVEKFEIV